MHVPQQDYERLSAIIANVESPVGIDAEKTHVLILYMLEDIQRRVQRVEEAVAARDVD